MKAVRIGVLFAVVATAYASSVTFTFDTQTINGTVINGLSDTATPTQVATYMNSVLTASGCTGCSVSVSSGTYADQTYNGEGHVVGPGTGATSLTLGNTNGATSSTGSSVINSTRDTFLANTSDSSAQSSDRVYFTFHGITINGAASFDYEIFPNGVCPSLPCSSVPDLTFEAGNNTNGTDATIAHFLSTTPNSPNDNNSPLSSVEVSPQAIGTWSGTLSNVTELDFVDWPATIGMDNLQISWTTNTNSPVPEPIGVVLLGSVIAGLLLKNKLRKA